MTLLVDALERQRARNRRRAIYAVIYSIGGLVGLGKLLFDMLAAMK